MSLDEINNLKLGDFIKLPQDNRSDEYYMVTQLDQTYVLRKVGFDGEVVKTDDLQEYVYINTSRD